MPDAYSAAGVDIDAANATVANYRSILAQHDDARVLQGIGAFSGCFALPHYREPVLVASTDGVGTKVLIASALRRYDGIGADLVHHCINDVACSNAQPLFFLDYLAMGKLDPDAATAIVRGIARACADNGIALLGGETAEMPGVYAPSHFDLAGTIVGALERDALLDLTQVVVGDAIIGLPANGLHTNGYSLARAALPQHEWHQNISADSEMSIADALLAVHPNYLRHIRAVQAAGVRVKSMAHITGGGLADNLPRAFPEHLAARVRTTAWLVPPIIELIVARTKLATEEAYRTFNMGVGFCLLVDPSATNAALRALQASMASVPIPGAETQMASVLGELEPRHPCGPGVIFD
ncbi:MAG: phosphoribosylformylglycinamidine cyclo-ligase [Candidatus Eremiobacteraeota bacterium]|nr:phosphoribosylformylglycinamidine cyclo-ligase [Candidatus Eremiobacteraeota bacterium]